MSRHLGYRLFSSAPVFIRQISIVRVPGPAVRPAGFHTTDTAQIAMEESTLSNTDRVRKRSHMG